MAIQTASRLPFYKVLVALPLFLLAGCAVPPKPPISLQNTFDVEQAKALLLKGTNTVKGSALIRQRNGGVVTCAGYTVWLTPYTAYAAERIKHFYGNHSKGYVNFTDMPTFVTTHPQYFSLGKEAKCNAQGFFEFKDIADGDFFVTAEVSWQVPINQYRSEWQGGFLMQQVTVGGGEIKELVLAP